MKMIRRPVKPSRACDDWYEDETVYYQVGSAYGTDGDDSPPRLRSVSPAAHAAIHHRPARKIGF